MANKNLLKAVLFLSLLLASAAINADVNSFLAGMVYSGTSPFDANDANAANNEVRTHDDASYRTAFSLTPSDTGAVVKYEIGSFTLPLTLISGVAPPTKVAYFDPLKLPTGSSGCQNISLSPIADPAPAGTSGVTADGQTVYCSLTSPIGGVTLDIPFTIFGNVPNGTTLDAPTITFKSDNNAATSSPTVANDGSTTFGMDRLTLTSSPQWDLTKDSLRGGLFIPKSGPAGEDGFVLGFNVAIHATGSRKGLEALNTAYFTDNYDDPEFPNAQLVNWNINSLGFSVVTNTDPNACAGWQTKQTAVGNYFDNGHYFPRDDNTGAVASYKIPNGGSCVVRTINNTLHTATFDLFDVDWSLSNYPTKKGTNAAAVTLVNAANLDDSTNEWWVGSKSILLWIPMGDVPADGVTRLLTNKAYLFGSSITGQANIEPVLTTADNTENSGVRNTVDGQLSLRYVPLKTNNPLGLDLAPRDPNVTGSSHVNQVSPGQVMDTQIATYNTGTTSFGTGMFCNKIDNSRLSYLNRTPAVAAYTVGANRVLDPDTGMVTRSLSGNISDIENLNFQLGVGGSGATNGGWDSFSGVTSEYTYPAATGSTNADSGCGDADATWFDSILALEAAGYSLQDINRVRGKYDSFTAGAKYLHYLPLKVRDTFAYSGTDTATGAYSANDSTLNSYSTTIVLWERGTGLADTETGDAALIFNNEFIQVSKSSPTHPDGSLASPGAQITYDLQVNATSSGAAHTTDVTVWDVLPNNLTYNTGSSMLGGVSVADPVCATTSLPVETFPLGTVPAGHSACKWVLLNQLATKTAVGNVAGNLPILSFSATVSVSAATNDQLLNTSFADSADNAKQKAYYDGVGRGFVCKTGQNCSFSNWLLSVSANPGIVLNKSVDQTLITSNSSFGYTLNYGVIGNSLSNVRLLEVLPYSGDSRGSNFSGTLSLSGAVTLDASDSTASVLYTKNSGTNIKLDPYDAGHNLNNGGTNTTSTTNWCSAAQFGNANCPANYAETNGIMILPFAGNPQSCGSYGVVPCLNPGSLYNVEFSVATAGNLHTDVYSNSFIGDSPGLLARAPGSNVVSSEVIQPDLVITKTVSPSVVDAGETATYIITAKNNTGAGVGPVTNTAGTLIAITDNLPSGIIITVASDVDGGANWDCSASEAPSTVSCLYDNSGLPIGVGGAIGNPITIDVLAGTLENTTAIDNIASIEMTGQAEISTNNTATATLTIKARPPSPDIPYAQCTTPDLSGIVPDGIPDFTFPRGYWATSYFEGAHQIVGSAAMSSDINGQGSAGIPMFRGEAFWGAGENPVASASNGGYNVVGTWNNTETPTTPSLPHPSYVGATWTSNGNPFYQVDFRRKIDVSGIITIGGLTNSYTDDSVEILINGTRVYGAFPGGGPDPWPNATNKGEVSVSADDEVLIRFINLGYIGGYDLSFDATGVDCSDAPVSYQDAWHIEDENLYLGSSVDDETGSITSANATGDGVDDDGVNLPTFTQAAKVTIPVVVNQAAANDGYLQGWIDWNGDGDFDDPLEQISRDLQSTNVGASTINIQVTIPPTAITTSQTFARFRWSSVSGLGNTATAPDGEVEDYALTINPGIPDTITRPERCGAFNSQGWVTSAVSGLHDNNVQFGSGDPANDPYVNLPLHRDAEGRVFSYFGTSDNPQSAAIPAPAGIELTTSQKDTVNHEAEYHSTVYKFQGVPGAVENIVYDTTAGYEYSAYWIEDTAGNVVEAADFVYTTTVAAGVGESFPISFTYPADGVVYLHTALFDPSQYYGKPVITGYSCLDFGDSPDTYGTSIASGGAQHDVINDVYLGASRPDKEPDGIPSATASDDDTIESDDEDGVAMILPLSHLDRTYRLTVNATNTTAKAARLIAWIDFDGNGSFEADEAAARVVPTGTSAGNIVVYWSNIPADIQQGATFLRLRFTTDNMNAGEAKGEKLDGEVEDYSILIGSSGATVSGRVYVDANSNKSQNAGEKGIAGTVVVLYDTLGNSCRSVKTDGNGDYRFTAVQDGSYELYQAHGETTPTPQSCGSSFSKNPVGYQSTTNDNLTLIVLGADIIDQNFGEVAGANSLVSGNTGVGVTFEPNHQSEVLPGNVVFYAHTFSSEAEGSVRFTTSSGGNNTAGWAHNLYRDRDCSGTLNGVEGNTPINGINFGISTSGKLCIIDKVFAPTNAQQQDQYKVEMTAGFNFTDITLAPIDLKVSDITTTVQKVAPETQSSPELGESRLKLRKTVENLTQNTAETATSNSAKPGDVLRYRIYYRNTGIGPITDLKVNDSMPLFTGFVLGSESCETPLPGLSCTASRNFDELLWRFTGSLQGGAEGNVSYEVAVDN